MNCDNLCWFHGKITHENTEKLIKQEGNVDGTFLVRESNTAPGDFVLAVLHKGVVFQYQIRRHGEDALFSIDDKIAILHGLDTLVQFYQQSAIGLITRLTTHIKKDPPPNYSRGHGVTNILHRATKENNQTVISELLKCGYRNVDAKNQDGQTAVHLAALHCDESILKLLLNAGVNVNSMDSAGNMPLHYACRNKSASFIRMLIAVHANVQGRNVKNGYVPLHEAAKNGNLDAIKELLAAHAPLMPRSDLGEFPIDLAKKTGQDKVVEYLNNCKPPLMSTFKAQWYHGTLTRDEASKALMLFAAELTRKQLEKTTMPDKTSECSANNMEELRTKAENEKENKQTAFNTSGCFLVRYSERKVAGSGYVLTLLWKGTVMNFLIKQNTNHLYWYIDNGTYLPSLEHLIQHFMRFSDGLPTRLKYPLLPKPNPPLPHFSTIPRRSHMKSTDALSTSKTADTKFLSMRRMRKHSLDDQLYDVSHHTEEHAKPLTGSNSFLSTLKKIGSIKRSFLTSSTNSLIRSKTKKKQSGAIEEQDKNASKVNEDELKTRKQDELKTIASALEKLSCSTLATNVQPQESATEMSAMSVPLNAEATFSLTASVAIPTDEVNNVPNNNSEFAAIPSSPASTLYPIEIESKTEEEVTYFTKSDVTIESERHSNGAIKPPPKFQLNANGYLPTVDIRVFLDPNADRESLDASAAELREFSNYPERLDSIISGVSTESELMRFLKRQNSTASTITQCSEARSSIASKSVVQTRLKYFISHDYLTLDDIIGGGEFGSVFKGSLIQRHSNRISNKSYRNSEPLICEVAIKTLRDDRCRKNKQEFLREASMMIRLHHHCIVQLIGISKGETLMMVQELAQLGSMKQYLLENKTNITANHELKLWASQIACGMQYLETQHFVHRDLAARNILLTSRDQVKIGDFGLSRALGSGNDCYQARPGGKWPVKWYAPESINNGLFSHASDVWSFGVTLWEMFSLGETPYGDTSGIVVIKLIDSGERLPKPELCPNHIYDIMKNCWNHNAKDRPTFHYLMNFFARDSYNQINNRTEQN